MSKGEKVAVHLGVVTDMTMFLAMSTFARFFSLKDISEAFNSAKAGVIDQYRTEAEREYARNIFESLRDSVIKMHSELYEE